MFTYIYNLKKIYTDEKNIFKKIKYFMKYKKEYFLVKRYYNKNNLREDCFENLVLLILKTANTDSIDFKIDDIIIKCTHVHLGGSCLSIRHNKEYYDIRVHPRIKMGVIIRTDKLILCGNYNSINKHSSFIKPLLFKIFNKILERGDITNDAIL